ncbi:MAG TPA: hypothetical protein VIM14_03255 [Polyangia bacterium]
MLRFGYAATVGTFLACLMFACGDKGYGLKPLSSGGAAGGGVSDTGGTLGTGAGGTTGIGDIDGGDSEAGVAIDGGGAGGIGGGTGGAGGAATAGVSYAQTIAPMMTKSCATSSACHAGSDPDGIVSLDNYADVKQYAALSLKKINDGTMPVPPVAPLSATDKANLQAWITGNFQP